MESMFEGATAFNQDLKNWKPTVKNVDTFKNMFRGATAFQNGGTANTLWWELSGGSAGIDMEGMFMGATAYNTDISFDTSGVVDMSGMFYNATSAQSSLSQIYKWDTSNVTSFENMFRGATSFNQDIKNWGVQTATTFNSMFEGATAFNKDIRFWSPKVTLPVPTFTNMFKNASTFNANVLWNTQTGFNNETPLGTFWTSNAAITDSNLSTAVAQYASNQADAVALYGEIGEWNTTAVTNMSNIFKDQNITYDISGWDTQNVTTFEGAFQNATNFNAQIGKWNTSKATTMKNMFNGATSFNQDIATWVVDKVTDMEGMFQGATSFNKTLKYQIDLSNFYFNIYRLSGTTKQYLKESTSSTGNFTSTTTLSDAAIFSHNISGDIQYMRIVGGRADGTDPRKIVQLYQNTLSAINLNTFNTNVNASTTQANYLSPNGTPTWSNENGFQVFGGGWLSGETSTSDAVWKMDVSVVNGYYWDTSSVTKFTSMFNGATQFNNGGASGTIPINWKINNRAGVDVVMSSMFKSATSFNQNISTWDVTRVRSFANMFEGATAFNQDISNWDPVRVNDMSRMFKNATAFNNEIRPWNISSMSTTDLAGFVSMFEGATQFNNSARSWYDAVGWDTAGGNTPSHTFWSNSVLGYDRDANDIVDIYVKYVSYDTSIPQSIPSVWRMYTDPCGNNELDILYGVGS